MHLEAERHHLRTRLNGLLSRPAHAPLAEPQRLRALRDTAPEFRGLAWAEFLRETDPVASTPEHEGLRDYFGRIEEANERFREEGGRGWLTDRGMVLVGLPEHPHPSPSVAPVCGSVCATSENGKMSVG